jgi:O-antigen ligase
MNNDQQADITRRNIAGVVAIVLGLAIGLFIKRVKIGLLIGIVLGFIAISLFKRK